MELDLYYSYWDVLNNISAWNLLDMWGWFFNQFNNELFEKLYCWNSNCAELFTTVTNWTAAVNAATPKSNLILYFTIIAFHFFMIY